MADLNVNSISNAAENGAPDFTHMPTVAGDPVVESGSNSDGEWVRFADGTQFCELESTWNSGGGISYTLPAPFSQTNYSVFGTALSTSATVVVLKAGVRGLSSVDLLGAVDGGTYASGNFNASFFGRWK